MAHFTLQELTQSSTAEKLKSLFEHARERKASVADMQQIIKNVVEAGNDRDARRVIKSVVDYVEGGEN